MNRHSNRVLSLLDNIRDKLVKACLFVFRRVGRRSTLIVGVLVIVMSVITTTVSQMTTSAATQATSAVKTATLSPSDQAKAFAYYRAFRVCMAVGYYKNSNGPIRNSSMSQQNAIDYDWFNGQKIGTITATITNGINVGAFNDPRGTSGDGSQNCGDSEGRAWLKAMAALFGYDSGVKLLCDLQFTRDSKSVKCTDTTAGANNNFNAPPASIIDSFWTGKNTGLGNSSSDISAITDSGGAYQLYLQNFKSQCRPSTSGSTYSIQEFANGSLSPHTVKYGAPDTSRQPDYKVTIYQDTQMSCADLAKKISDPNSAVVMGYTNWLTANKDPSGKPPTLCSDGSKPPANGNCPTTPNNNQTTCAIATIGWIVCPVIGFLGNITDGIFGFVSQLLVLNPSFASGEATRTASRAVLNIANVGLVIVFLFIVFSQLTGLGISNYGVKKMLPRLVVAAIAMQISMFLCAIAVDVSNIAGSGTYQLLTGVADQASSSSAISVCADGSAPTSTGSCADGSNPQLLDPSSSGNAAAGVGFFAAVAGIAVVATTTLLWGSIGLLVPVLLAALAAIAVTLGILLARWVLVVVLVVLAPIAILAMVLPNTQKLFVMWRKWFIAMLTVYVMVALLFGGAKLAAVVIGGALGDMGINGIFAAILAGAVMVLPLIFTPKLLQGSLNAIPIVGGVAKKLSGSANSRLSGAARQVRQGSNFAKTLQARRAARLENNKKAFERTAAGEYKRDKNGQLILDKNGVPQRTIGSNVLGGMLVGNKTAQKNVRKLGSEGATEQDYKDIDRQLQDAKVANPNFSAQDTLDYHTKSVSTGHKYKPDGSLVTDKNGQPVELSATEKAAHMQHLAQTRQGQTVLRQIADGQILADVDARQLAVERLGADMAGRYKARTGQTGGGGGGTPPPPSSPPPSSSDRRLKTDIHHLKKLSSGINLYSFRYLWSEQVYVGVIAQEILLTHPSAVVKQENGYYAVHYWQLGIRMVTMEGYIANPECIMEDANDAVYTQVP